METTRGFDHAFAELEKLVLEIEDENIQLDVLAGKVKQANELIMYCETKLRSITADVQQQMGK